MKEINFNYAATSAKKPTESINAMIEYLSVNDFSSPARGGEESLRAGRIELDTRMALCEFFHIKRPEQIIFTPNVTIALNMVINGIAKPGMHVITTEAEHNAVARPLEYLKEKGIIELTYLPVINGTYLNTESLESYFRPNTGLFVMTHASNVTGSILPYEKCASAAKAHNIPFVLDTAQTAGLIDIDFENSLIDVLTFTGHKSLMGPSGTGGFILKPHMTDKISPVISGGTGSMSHLLTQPEFLPDKFQPGTPNILGIIGLKASVEFLTKTGIDKIFAHELALTRMFMEGVAHEDIIIYGPKSYENRVPVVSFNIKGMDNGILGEMLYDEYGIITRSGLHCAPLIHQAMGTYPEGVLRASFGYYTTEEEVKYGIEAVKKILISRKG